MIGPSLAACFLSTPYWEVSFVAAFDYAPYLSASKTFGIMFGDSWQYVWPVVVVAVLQVLGAALVMSAIDRHFRTGRLSLRSSSRLINNTVFPIAIGVAIMSVMSIVWRFVLFGLVTLVQVIGSAAAMPSGVALAIISAVAVGMFLLHVLILSPMLFWAPIMFIYGYRFRDAAAASFKLLAGKKIFIGLFLPTLICAGIQLLVGFLQAPYAVCVAVGFVVFLFTNVYATVYTMIAFYGISGLDRRDVEPYREPLPLPQKRVGDEKSDATDPVENSDVQPQESDKQQKPKPKQRQKQKQPDASQKRERGVAKNRRKPTNGDGGENVV